MTKTKRIVLLSLMVTQALILSIVESWLPVQALIPGVPGIKLGLANIVTIIVITGFGLKDALVVVTLRCVISSLFGGGPIVFLFSIAGGILSTLVMAVLYKRMSNVFSLMGISIAGAVAHNIGQILVASAVMGSSAVLWYLPVLLVAGIIMGSFIGLCSNYLSNALKKAMRLK